MSNFFQQTMFWSVYFPGLLDPKETAEVCGIRELKEETGYVGTVKHVSPGR